MLLFHMYEKTLKIDQNPLKNDPWSQFSTVSIFYVSPTRVCLQTYYLLPAYQWSNCLYIDPREYAVKIRKTHVSTRLKSERPMQVNTRLKSERPT
jgi:hypothetical protein